MVSVALCTYNGASFIEEQLASIISQSVPVDEIIICDDGSTDGTTKIIADFKESHPNVDIQIFINKNNIGVTKNFEHALHMCNGDIIFLSDQDDIWHQRKVEITVKAFNADNKCLLVFTDAFLVDADGNDLGIGLWELTKPKLKANYTVSDFTGARYVTGATVAIRRELLSHTIPIPGCWIHDAWLSINASVYGNIKYIDEKLLYYRQHENNVIGAKKRSLIERILHTKSNIQKSIIFRGTMKDRFSILCDRIEDKLTDEEKKDLTECISFWNDANQIAGNSMYYGMRTIVKNVFNGSYQKYYHSLNGALVDLFILMR